MRSLQFYTGSREEKIEEFTEEFYPEPAGRSKEQIKQMMNYIQENYAEKLTVSEIASAAFICERECYRIFRKCLQMTPTEYLTGFRMKERSPSRKLPWTAEWEAAVTLERYLGSIKECLLLLTEGNGGSLPISDGKSLIL